MIINQKPVLQVLLDELSFPEGPAYSSDGALWLVELKGGRIVRYKDGRSDRYPVGGAPNGIAIDSLDQVWFCDAAENAIRVLDPVSRQTRTAADLIEGQPLNAPNDLAFDRHGNLVFTCPGNSRQEPTGYVCVLTPDGRVKKITEGKYFPNGLCFTVDRAQLIIAETYSHSLWKGNWDSKNAEWTDEERFCKVGGPDGPGGPDGITLSAAGTFYVALYGCGVVREVNLDGHLLRDIDVPGLNPTNCVFQPDNQKILIVTEAEKGMLLAVEV